MKLVKNFVFAVLLVSALAFNTFAGDVELPGAPAPKPAQQQTYDEKSVTVTGTATQEPGVETSDYFIYEALAALLSLY